ncbi:MAG: UDP-3-O-[3-hydroxymyristoyl] N-acetylglucosamine deacetylase [Candidatus Sericytochromatia bacterium]|uniref:UDP-3-O-acyl-N-acetylglucosamine deacetylase n=1 Tax=Candidatus Tanganyikabacteria bacterium TaxID=2961651 RepID=A0A937X893_9BACT|nr:UDP-3-O-[3-hydroxymyristoyl] N-acetylglucosamine deacetylase [Candidatus Tanganyikabacteria bacterium]
MPHSTLDSTRQWTLRQPFTLTGVGLHSGEPVNVRVLPAPPNHGLAFSRVDLPGKPRVPALAEYVSDVTLSTTVARGRASVRTIEHMLAALAGMGVSNALIAVDGPEIPAMDGSALAFTRAIVEAGRVALPAERAVISIPEHYELDMGDRSLLCQPREEAVVTYVVDYGHPLAGVQCWEGLINPAAFRRELAPARTFCLRADAERMRAAGMARGGSFDNAVVVMEDGYSSTLRFDDEFVRHKVLDLIGDLALAGADWRGQVVAVKAGHPLHVQLATRLRQYVLALEKQRSVVRTKIAAYAS